MPSSTLGLKAAQTVSGRPNWSLLLVAVGLIAVLQVLVASRSGLWADEIFSLALATGHSLEHGATAADPHRGDFVEPNHPVPAEEFRSYLKHEGPPDGSSARDSGGVTLRYEPTTLLPVALRVDTRVRHERHRYPVVLDYVCPGLPATSCQHCGAYGGSSLFQLCPFRILTIGDLLFDRRSDVLAPVAVRACNDMGFARPAATRTRYRNLRFLDHGVSSRVFDPLLLRVSMAGHCRVSLDYPGKTRAAKPGSVSFPDRYAHSPMVRKTPGESSRLADYKGLAEGATVRI